MRQLARVTLATVAAWTLALLLPAGAARASDALARGNEAFSEGKFEEAAAIYESDDAASDPADGSRSNPDLLLRRFNAGVSWGRAGDGAKAIQRFEEVSSRAEGELRASALYNAGCAHFERGKKTTEEAMKLEGTEEKLKRLGEAATAYRSAAEFFRKVDPPSEDAAHDLSIAKTALHAVVDLAARIQDEERRKAEDEALKSPPELLRTLAAKERLHRSLARTLAKESGAKARLGARRLRKSEAENRGLTEKLHHHLTAPPPAPPAGAPAGTEPPAPAEEEKARKEAAAGALGRVIAAQKDAEVAYAGVDLARAMAAHGKAIDGLREAMEAFPLNLPQLLGEAVPLQEGLNGAMESLVGDGAPSTEGPGAAKAIVDAIKDRVLKPIAKLIGPKDSGAAQGLAEEEDEVVWVSKLLSKAEVQPTPEPPAGPGQPGGAGPGAPGGGPPALSPEKAKELSEALRREGETAHAASSKAREELAGARVEPALPEGKKALEALERAVALLPKPPESPEERIRKLIERQGGAREAVDGLADVEPGPRKDASARVGEEQRADGKEAGAVAEELEKRQDEPAKKAAGKVREGEAQVFSSAEALERERLDESKLSIERDLKAFEEALAILSGKQGQDQQDQQDQQGQDKKQEEDLAKKKDSKQESGGDKKKEKQEKKKGRYALSPRDARLLRDEMDRKRREEEAKIFAAPSTVTAPKDW
jgi:hypothetical protein